MLCDSVKFSEKKYQAKCQTLIEKKILNSNLKFWGISEELLIITNSNFQNSVFQFFSTLNIFSRWLVCNKIIQDLALIIQNRNTRSVRKQMWEGNRLDGIQVTLQLPRNIYYKDSFPGNNMIYNKVWFEAKLLVHDRFFLGIRNVCWEYN